MKKSTQHLVVGFVAGGVAIAIVGALLSSSKAAAAPAPPPPPPPAPHPGNDLPPKPNTGPDTGIFGRWGNIPPKFPVPDLWW